MNNLHRVYLSLGSNIDPQHNLPKAIKLLRKAGKIEAISSVWETKSVGFDGPNFFNTCALFLTHMQSFEIKEKIIRPIEAELGRIRYANKNAPRTIDIDLLLYDDTLLNTKFWDYVFVAVPLAELIPDLEHPIHKEKLSRIAEQVRGEAWIVKREDMSL